MTDSSPTKRARKCQGMETAVVDLVDWCGRRCDVVTMEHSATAGEAFETLARENILSAPVVVAPSIDQPEANYQYLGMLDTADLLFHVMRTVRGLQRDGKEDLLKQSWDALKEAGHQLCDAKLITICGKDSGFGFPMDMGRSIQELITDGFLRLDKSPAHRMVLLNLKGRFTGIVSQSDVVRFAAAHPECFKEGLLEKTLEELDFLAAGGERQNVVCVNQSIRAIDAFERMEQEGMSCVGVTNDAGELVANLSGSDLRGLRRTSFVELLLGVTDFLALQKKAEVECHSLRPGDTLRTLVDKFRKLRVHRLYVTDKNKAPLAVITLTDLLRLLASQ